MACNSGTSILPGMDENVFPLIHFKVIKQGFVGFIV